jgi:hypothetical protein
VWQYCDRLYPETGKTAVDHSDDDCDAARPKKKGGGVSDELAAEIAALKETSSAPSKKKRFWVLDLVRMPCALGVLLCICQTICLSQGCRGLFFVRIMLPEIDVMKLARAIFEDIAANKAAKTRFTVRLIPLQVMCYPSVAELAAAVEKLAEPFFHKGVSRRVRPPGVGRSSLPCSSSSWVLSTISSPKSEASRAWNGWMS